MTAKTLWSNLEKMYPDVIGPENPNNAKIKALFGNKWWINVKRRVILSINLIRLFVN